MKNFLKKLWDKIKYVLLGIVTAVSAFFILRFKAKKDSVEPAQVSKSQKTLSHIKDSSQDIDTQVSNINKALVDSYSNPVKISDLLNKSSKLSNQAASQIQRNKFLLK